jgi:hypothetical protein
LAKDARKLAEKQQKQAAKIDTVYSDAKCTIDPYSKDTLGLKILVTAVDGKLHINVENTTDKLIVKQGDNVNSWLNEFLITLGILIVVLVLLIRKIR